MATDASNVRVATTGGVYRAPSGTSLPTSEDATRDAAFVELGYIGEDGVTESQGTSTNQIRAWQNGDIVREVQTEHNLTYSFTAIESNAEVLEAFYGNYDAGTIEINGLQPTRGAWVLEAMDGDEHIRIVIPDGQVTERGDVVWQNGEAIGYPFTVTAYPDPDYTGDLDAPAKAYIYRSLPGS